MKTGFLIISIIILAGVSAGFSKCGAKIDNKMAQNISDAEKLSGMKFPSSAKILSAVNEGGHDGTKYEKWIIQTSEPVELKGGAIEGDNNETFIKSLKEELPEVDFGQPKNDKYEFSDWQNQNGKWQAAAIETDKGFFVKLESINLD